MLWLLSRPLFFLLHYSVLCTVECLSLLSLSPFLYLDLYVSVGDVLIS